MKRKSKQVNPADGWTRQEAGWYTHPELGLICRERDGGWWRYDNDRGYGPYKTLLAARCAAAELAAQKGQTK